MYDTPCEETHTGLPHDLPLGIGNQPVFEVK